MLPFVVYSDLLHKAARDAGASQSPKCWLKSLYLVLFRIMQDPQ